MSCQCYSAQRSLFIRVHKRSQTNREQNVGQRFFILTQQIVCLAIFPVTTSMKNAFSCSLISGVQTFPILDTNAYFLAWSIPAIRSQKSGASSVVLARFCPHGTTKHQTEFDLCLTFPSHSSRFWKNTEVGQVTKVTPFRTKIVPQAWDYSHVVKMTMVSLYTRSTHAYALNQKQILYLPSFHHEHLYTSE